MTITLNATTGITTPAETTVGDESVGGNLTVAGTTSITGNTTVGGTLAVTGNTTVTGTLTASGGVSGSIRSATAQASTSGTSIDFTSIPSGVKRITVMLNGLSTNGTSNYLVQIGAGSVTTTGYLGSSTATSTSSGTTSFTTGFGIYNNNGAANVIQGNIQLTLLSSNTWTASGTFGNSNTIATVVTGGGVTLSGTLDRVRITTVNGTDTFDAGSINILYE